MFPSASTAPGTAPGLALKKRTLASMGATPSPFGASPYPSTLPAGTTNLGGTHVTATDSTPLGPTPAPIAPKPMGFQGMDPSGSIDPQLARTQIEGALGGKLTPAQIQEAISLSGWSGTGPLSGAQYNTIAQTAAQRSGHPFNPYAAPQAPPGHAPVAPQDMYKRTPLELPVTDAPPLNVPDLQLPGNFDSPTYQPPANYEAARLQQQNPFHAPTAEEAANNPGYAFARDEAVRALQNSAAAGGSLHNPNTRDAITQRVLNMASQNYGDVYDRAVGEYGLERQGNLDTYGAAREGGIDKYDRDYQAANTLYDRTDQGLTNKFNRGVDLGSAQYDAGFQNSIARYEQTRATWDARTSATQRANEVNYDGDWQSRLFGVDDGYRRQRDAVGDTRYTNEFNRDEACYARADWWRTQDSDTQRKQFLASLGLAAS